MADKFIYVNLDLNGQQIKNVKAEILSSEPTGSAGRFYYNSTTGAFGVYDAVNSQWVYMGTGNGTVESVVAGDGINVDATDPANPIVSVDIAYIIDDSSASTSTTYSSTKILELLTGVASYQGALDCSTNPNYPAATQGYYWVVSVAGKIGGASGANVQVGDFIFCNTTNAGGTQASVGADFDIVQGNIDINALAGAGLVVNGAALDVNVDDVTIEINGSDEVAVKAGGISEVEISSASFSSTGGIIGGSGDTIAIKPDVTTGATVVPVALSANGAGITVDNSSIENNAGTAQVKALGITNEMLAGSIADSKLSTISTANKVSGSAVQLNAAGAIVNSTGLAVQVDGSTTEINGSNQIGIKNAGVGVNQISSDIAGNGLGGGSGSALSVNVDNSSIEISADALQVKAGGVTNAMLAGSITYNKLATTYTASFVSGDFSAGVLTIAAATHGLGASKYMEVEVFNSADVDVSSGVIVTTATSGDVTVTVNSGLEFNGYIIITRKA